MVIKMYIPWEGIVEVGAKSAEELIRAVRRIGGCISFPARHIIYGDHFRIGESVRKLPIAVICTSDLIRVTESVDDISQLYDRALELGLQKCPVDLALHLFIQHHQEICEKAGDVWIAMNPVIGTWHATYLFKLTTHQHYVTDPKYPGIHAEPPPIDFLMVGVPSYLTRTYRNAVVPSRFVFVKG